MYPLSLVLIKASFFKKGKNLKIGLNCKFVDYRLIEIGDNVYMGAGTNISCNVPVRIGDNVMFGPEVMILAGNHKIDVVGVPMRSIKEGGINLPVEIENDVWIGARTIILKGVIIREGSVVGAGSLVTKSILPYSINIGVPNKLARCRFSKAELRKHLQLVSSQYSIEQIEIMYNENGFFLDEE